MKTLICTILTLALIGCENSRPRVRSALKPAPEPPQVPARQNLPLDPAMRDLAKRQLYAAARSNDPILRANALEAMQDTLGEAAADEIIHALADPNALVRFAACMAAGKLKLRPAYQPLSNMLFDADDNVKVGSRYALHRLGDTRQSRELETLARNDSDSVRGNVALALGLLGEPSAINTLKSMMSDRAAIVRLQVAEAMWRLGSPTGLDVLVAGTVSGFPDDQAICVLALAQPRDARVRTHIFGKLTSNDPEIALIAARGMGMIGSDAGYGVALNGAKSPDPRQKSLAALAFGQIGRSDAQPVLAPMLRDQNPQVRLATATAILQLRA